MFSPVYPLVVSFLIQRDNSLRIKNFFLRLTGNWLLVVFHRSHCPRDKSSAQILNNKTHYDVTLWVKKHTMTYLVWTKKPFLGQTICSQVIYWRMPGLSLDENPLETCSHHNSSHHSLPLPLTPLPPLLSNHIFSLETRTI